MGTRCNHQGCDSTKIRWHGWDRSHGLSAGQRDYYCLEHYPMVGAYDHITRRTRDEFQDLACMVADLNPHDPCDDEGNTTHRLAQWILEGLEEMIDGLEKK